MDPVLHQEILHICNLSLSWHQPFCVPHNSRVGLPMLNAPNQQKMPYGLVYWFDKKIVRACSWSALKKIIRELLPGTCSFHVENF